MVREIVYQIVTFTCTVAILCDISGKGVAGTCRAGEGIASPLVPLPANLNGTYLNTQCPITFSNNITKLHYCYYTEAATPGSTLSMTLAVWSLDADTNTYIVSPTSIRNVTLSHNQTNTKILCVEESLNEDEYIIVSAGDVIGVFLPCNNSIPVAGFIESSPDKCTMKHRKNCLSLNNTWSDQCRIHLCIDAKLASTENSTQIQANFFTSNSTICYSIPKNGLSGGGTTAFVISILTITGAFLLAAIVWIRNKYKYKLPENQLHNDIHDNCGGNTSSGIYEPIMNSNYSECSTNAYSTPIVNTSAYQKELENIKQGKFPEWQENIYSDPADNEEDIYSFLKNRKIANILGERIVVGRVLGSGQFGTVHQGSWKKAPREMVDVALKSLNNDASSTNRLKFLQEAATMAQFRHPNVAALYGVTEKDETTMIVVELLPKGDLLQYLHTLKPDPGELILSHTTPNLLLHFSQQVCLGMSYLTTIGFVHRDLAARNILLSSTLVCKIADFGMSRDLHEGDYYTSSGGMIPVKWTAPEALQYKKYSTASDVWSYGCVLYEIWSLGYKPFEDRSNVEVLRVIDTGNRMAPPPGCPKRMYDLMITCWNPNPKQRPSFRDILISMLENENVVLHIPSDVTNAHSQAATLGAPLKAGYQMYVDLQRTYI